MAKKVIAAGERVALQLTAEERNTLLDDMFISDMSRQEQELMEIVDSTPPREAVMFTLLETEELLELVMMKLYELYETDETGDPRQRKHLETIASKLQEIVDTYDEQPQLQLTLPGIERLDVEDEELNDDLEGESPEAASAGIVKIMTEFVSAAHAAGLSEAPLEDFRLSKGQVKALQEVPGVTASLRNKFLQKNPICTVVEGAEMVIAIIQAVFTAKRGRQEPLFAIAAELESRIGSFVNKRTRLREALMDAHLQNKKPGVCYQFKITLRVVKPPIWRRIAIEDGTLDDLHCYIQAAMGWECVHLHQFLIDERTYARMDELEDDPFAMETTDFDSSEVLLSELLAGKKKGYKFRYDYDFGDGWEHDIVFEGELPMQPDQEYPVCLAGARACPPEDVGGPWGYAEFLEAIKDPQHESNQMYPEWHAEGFLPEEFSIEETTADMRHYAGLGDDDDDDDDEYDDDDGWEFDVVDLTDDEA